MKKCIKVMGLVFTMLLFSGCMKSTVDIKVNSDGSVDVSYIAAVSSKASEEMKEQVGSEDENDLFVDEKQIQEARDNGYEISDYKDDNYQGIKVSKHLNSIDEISKEEEVIAKTSFAFEDDQHLFTVKRGFFTNKYIAKISYSDEKEDQDKIKEYQNIDEYKEFFEGMDLSFNLELPSKAIKSNATLVDNNKYTWDLTKFDQEYIEFEFEMINIKNIIICLIIVCGLIAIIVGTIIFIKKKKKI